MDQFWNVKTEVTIINLINSSNRTRPCYCIKLVLAIKWVHKNCPPICFYIRLNNDKLTCREDLLWSSYKQSYWAISQNQTLILHFSRWNESFFAVYCNQTCCINQFTMLLLPDTFNSQNNNWCTPCVPMCWKTSSNLICL